MQCKRARTNTQSVLIRAQLKDDIKKQVLSDFQKNLHRHSIIEKKALMLRNLYKVDQSTYM